MGPFSPARRTRRPAPASLALAIERVGHARAALRERLEVLVAPAAAEDHDIARLQVAVLALVLREDRGRDLWRGGPRLPRRRANEVRHVDDPRPSARLLDR